MWIALGVLGVLFVGYVILCWLGARELERDELLAGSKKGPYDRDSYREWAYGMIYRNHRDSRK